MKNILMVFFGSGIGGILRFWGSNVVYKFLPATFPYGTLFVNFIGSTLLGFFMYYLDYKKLMDQNLKLFLTIGLCGGLTTFSTFSYETISLLKNKEYLFAGVNVISNILITLTALFLTYKLSKF
ncbi:MAG TPA: fluoride efflux transporter CrcB [Ignavibacteriaceae bacterium]|nr:fluoride efflux transporter CrcB [Ignavibacteriaceae bacterium]